MRPEYLQRIGVAAWLALASSGCVAWRVESVPAAQLLRGNGPTAVRIGKADRTRMEIYDAHLSGDSIVGHPTDRAIARVAIPLNQIQTISTRHKSFGRTVLITLAVAGGVGAYALLQSLNQGY